MEYEKIDEEARYLKACENVKKEAQLYWLRWSILGLQINPNKNILLGGSQKMELIKLGMKIFQE